MQFAPDQPTPLEPEPLIPRLFSGEDLLWLLLATLSAIMASAFALAFEATGVSTFATELFHHMATKFPREVYFLVPVATSLALTLPVAVRSDARLPVLSVAVFVVLSAIAILHEWQLRHSAFSMGALNDFLVFKYSTWALGLAAVAGWKNWRDPSRETAYLFNIWMMAWLFSLAFPGIAVVW
jgi:hypothetical protein